MSDPFDWQRHEAHMAPKGIAGKLNAMLVDRRTRGFYKLNKLGGSDKENQVRNAREADASRLCECVNSSLPSFCLEAVLLNISCSHTREAARPRRVTLTRRVSLQRLHPIATELLPQPSVVFTEADFASNPLGF